MLGHISDDKATLKSQGKYSIVCIVVYVVYSLTQSPPCISAVDNSPNLLFSSIIFVDKTWLPAKTKFYAERQAAFISM